MDDDASAACAEETFKYPCTFGGKKELLCILSSSAICLFLAAIIFHGHSGVLVLAFAGRVQLEVRRTYLAS